MGLAEALGLKVVRYIVASLLALYPQSCTSCIGITIWSCGCRIRNWLGVSGSYIIYLRFGGSDIGLEGSEYGCWLSGVSLVVGVLGCRISGPRLGDLSIQV